MTTNQAKIDKKMGLSEKMIELKNHASKYPIKTLLTIINEELHQAVNLEDKVEILVFKSDVLEKTVYGECTNPYTKNTY